MILSSKWKCMCNPADQYIANKWGHISTNARAVMPNCLILEMEGCIMLVVTALRFRINVRILAKRRIEMRRAFAWLPCIMGEDWESIRRSAASHRWPLVCAGRRASQWHLEPRGPRGSALIWGSVNDTPGTSPLLLPQHLAARINTERPFGCRPASHSTTQYSLWHLNNEERWTSILMLPAG